MGKRGSVWVQAFSGVGEPWFEGHRYIVSDFIISIIRAPEKILNKRCLWE